MKLLRVWQGICAMTGGSAKAIALLCSLTIAASTLK
jgi:hypothetical protein